MIKSITEKGKIYSGSPKEETTLPPRWSGSTSYDDGTEWESISDSRSVSDKGRKGIPTEGTEKVKAWNFENVTYYRAAMSLLRLVFRVQM